MKNKGILIVVSGFSGAGKGTLMKKLLQTYDNYALSISMTTRSPREGEVDQIDYFFLSQDEFKENIAKDNFIEYASYCGNYYGTPKSYVEQQLESGKDVILEIETQGALDVKVKFPETLLLFVTSPTVEILKERLEGRGTESQEVIQHRLDRAIEEAKCIEKYDYLVINDDLQRCLDEIHHTVSIAKNVPIRNIEFIKNIRDELINSSKGER